jgi:hypothetical protein
MRIIRLFAESIWSAMNIAKFAALTEQGKITHSGAAAFVRRTQEKSKVYAFEEADDAEPSAAARCRLWR